MHIIDFAILLNGREYLSEITKQEEQQAKELGFVVIFGASDDLVELRGAIYDEVSAWGGTTIYFDKNGLLENKCDDDDCYYYQELKRTAKTVEAVWGEEGCSWIFKTGIRHIAFNIMEDGEKYCRGIVFDIKDLK